MDDGKLLNTSKFIDLLEFKSDSLADEVARLKARIAVLEAEALARQTGASGHHVINNLQKEGNASKNSHQITLDETNAKLLVSETERVKLEENIKALTAQLLVHQRSSITDISLAVPCSSQVPSNLPLSNALQSFESLDSVPPVLVCSQPGTRTAKVVNQKTGPIKLTTRRLSERIVMQKRVRLAVEKSSSSSSVSSSSCSDSDHEVEILEEKYSCILDGCSVRDMTRGQSTAHRVELHSIQPTFTFKLGNRKTIIRENGLLSCPCGGFNSKFTTKLRSHAKQCLGRKPPLRCTCKPTRTVAAAATVTFKDLDHESVSSKTTANSHESLHVGSGGSCFPNSIPVSFLVNGPLASVLEYAIPSAFSPTNYSAELTPIVSALHEPEDRGIGCSDAECEAATQLMAIGTTILQNNRESPLQPPKVYSLHSLDDIISRSLDIRESRMEVDHVESNAEDVNVVQSESASTPTIVNRIVLTTPTIASQIVLCPSTIASQIMPVEEKPCPSNSSQSAIQPLVPAVSASKSCMAPEPVSSPQSIRVDSKIPLMCRVETCDMRGQVFGSFTELSNHKRYYHYTKIYARFRGSIEKSIVMRSEDGFVRCPCKEFQTKAAEEMYKHSQSCVGAPEVMGTAATAAEPTLNPTHMKASDKTSVFEMTASITRKIPESRHLPTLDPFAPKNWKNIIRQNFTNVTPRLFEMSDVLLKAQEFKLQYKCKAEDLISPFCVSPELVPEFLSFMMSSVSKQYRNVKRCERILVGPLVQSGPIVELKSGGELIKKRKLTDTDVLESDKNRVGGAAVGLEVSVKKHKLVELKSSPVKEKRAIIPLPRKPTVARVFVPPCNSNKSALNVAKLVCTPSLTAKVPDGVVNLKTTTGKSAKIFQLNGPLLLASASGLVGNSNSKGKDSQKCESSSPAAHDTHKLVSPVARQPKDVPCLSNNSNPSPKSALSLSAYRQRAEKLKLSNKSGIAGETPVPKYLAVEKYHG
ncbi:hypothetical protein BDR26DRAFT_1009689 [Obelidium mucronatum]|nr:hypothetical protein BDR26DRAFT_1009689 [Obelidium mucronatum]